MQARPSEELLSEAAREAAYAAANVVLSKLNLQGLEYDYDQLTEVMRAHIDEFVDEVWTEVGANE